MNNEANLTVGELIDHLSVFSRDATVGLTFYRTKLRGKDLVQVEFNEQVYRAESGELVVEELS